MSSIYIHIYIITIIIKRYKFAVPPTLVPRANGRSEGGEGEEKEGAGGVRQGYNPRTTPSFAPYICKLYNA
jgi:hypothetical protein